VLGAGAARLAIDLHGARADTTIALDVNPLPFVIAKRLAAGEALQLFELPLRPRDSGHTFVDRTLRASALPDANFHFLFADGLTPPLVDGSIDTLLTPWFIDQIPTDMATLVPEIGRVLADGGRWVNFGPLLYQPTHTRLAHRYCFDEVLELAREAGFEVERHTIERMRYMESPACCQGRTELVLTFSAIKGEPIARPEPARAAWREDLDAPVPRFAGLAEYQPPHPMFAAVAALIDGQRSARAIAAVLVAQHGLPADEAPAAVQACLGEIARKLGN
jgi:hypothetical protein